MSDHYIQRYYYLHTEPSYTNHMEDCDVKVDPVYCIFDRMESSTREIAICFKADCAIKLIEGLNSK